MGAVPIESVYSQIVRFSREAGARRVILFGSRARGTNSPKSDIDLAIEGCPNFSVLEDRLQNELCSLLQLDIINLDDSVTPELLADIRRDGRVLYDRGREEEMRKFENYSRALDVLEQAPEQDLGNEFIQGGIIDKFFLQFELGWKLFKALLAYEGAPVAASGSPRDIIKASNRYFDFLDEDVWLGMLRDRNNTAHVYDEGKALELIDRILAGYIPEFVRVRQALIGRYGDLLTQPDLPA